MNKRMPSLFYRWRQVFWPVALVLTLYFGSAGTAPEVPRVFLFPHFDKVAHFFVFGLLGTLIYRVLPRGMNRRRRALLAVLIVSAYGGIDEARQGLNPERTMDFCDWIADSAGATVAVFFYLKWSFYRNLLEWPIRLGKRRDEDRRSIEESERAPSGLS